jgi:branched-chain amino acid transport system permease protein
VIIFLQSILNGLLIGGVYALVAMGLNLMFGVMKLVNFSHGEFLMAGMYVAVGLASLGTLPGTFGMFGIYWVAIPSMFVMAAAGFAFYLLLLDRAARFGESPQILLTIGLSIGAQGLAQVLRGSGFKLVPNPINGAAIRFGGLNLQIGPTIAFIVAVAVTIMMAWILRATRFGKSARAVAESVETAEMVGINARRVYIVSTSIAIGLVGLAAALLIPYHYTFPNVGQNFVVVAFLAIVIAGLGNVVGAMFGGLLMGIMQSLTASYFDLDLSTAAIYLLFLAVLLLRPQGLFTHGRRTL